MARVRIVGAETGDIRELAGDTTGFSASSTATLGGYSFKGSQNTGICFVAAGYSLSHPRFKFFWRYDNDTVPTSGNFWQGRLIHSYDSGGALQAAYTWQFKDDGFFYLLYFDSSGSLQDTLGPYTLAKDTWYRFEVDFLKGAGTGAIKLYQDGVQLHSATSQQLGANNSDRWIIGEQFADIAGRGAYWDDCEIDDSALCGPSYVIARQVKSGAPTYNAWSKSTGNIDAVWADTPFSAATNASSSTLSAAQTGLISSLSSTQTGHGSGVVTANDAINGCKVGMVAKTAYTTAAGIIQIGATQAGSITNGNDVTLTFNVAPVEGDLVIVWGGHTSTRPTPIGPSTGGYALWPGSTVQTQSTNTFGVWYKVMGATPDTAVVGQGTGNNADATAYGCIVLRMADTTTPSDATIVFANGSSTNPDPASITPSNTGDAVLICAGSVINDSAWSNPSGYSATVAAGSTDTNPYSVGGSIKFGLTGGTPENPAAFTSVSNGVWIAATICIRPAADAGSAAKIRRRLGGADTDTAVALTTSDAYYETGVF